MRHDGIGATGSSWPPESTVRAAALDELGSCRFAGSTCDWCLKVRRMTEEATPIRSSRSPRQPSPQAMRIATALSDEEPPDVTLLGAGTDHAAFLIDGRWVLREPLEPSPDAAGAVDREQRLLVLLDEVCPVPVPWPVASDASAGVIVLERLQGTSLLDVPRPDVEALLDPLAAVFTALATVPEAAVQELVARDEHPMETYLDEVRLLADDLVDVLSSAQQGVLNRFLDAELPPEPEPHELVLCHNDLGAEHILVTDDGRISGLIDWSDAAWGDPAHDLGRIARDLGPAAAERIGRRFHRAYDELRPRVRFHACCALVEDLAYGVTSGEPRYSDAALSSFDRTFHFWASGDI